MSIFFSIKVVTSTKQIFSYEVPNCQNPAHCQGDSGGFWCDWIDPSVPSMSSRLTKSTVSRGIIGTNTILAISPPPICHNTTCKQVWGTPNRKIFEAFTKMSPVLTQLWSAEKHPRITVTGMLPHFWIPHNCMNSTHF